MTHRIPRTLWAAAALLAATLAGAPSAFAQDPFTKLGRGIANLLTGWVEIPKNVYQTSVEQNPFAGLTAGLAKGTGAAFKRTGLGAVEAVTFPVPGPSNYSSAIEPEYVF
jgi:putative exosortase-associated protein (TIGR04073 family)